MLSISDLHFTNLLCGVFFTFSIYRVHFIYACYGNVFFKDASLVLLKHSFISIYMFFFFFFFFLFVCCCCFFFFFFFFFFYFSVSLLITNDKSN